MRTVLKIKHSTDDIYQVIELSLSDDEYYDYEDESTLYQGSISDCEAYIRAKENGYLT